ncbi:hypothetical protein KL953_26140 [Mycolicibacterium goodii]|uniref:hypothetical protein n=1 Tax=Mycolicibacterium goodii TaxID=134601 RepID=UPI000C266F68|nr:hypothetical protein [Mycolicibacterium goodii]MBU8818076.1 hypothetical protein [Mycolicibacterium goodii]PJK18648.1 hypothetical protein CSX11_30205 [Mycolicibacterium goodii]
MGRRFAGGAARQHPDLTPAAVRVAETDDADPVFAGIVLTLLAIDGVISAVVGALFLPIYIGTVPFPISALLTGAVNLALVWAAAHWSDSLLRAGLPLWTWLLTVVAMTLGGPGGDLIFAGSGIYAFGAMIFLVLGALPAAWFLRRRFH